MYMEPENILNNQNNLNKKKADGIIIPDLEIRCNATVIKQYGTGTKADTNRSGEKENYSLQLPSDI